jgi:hypothetical protein
MPELTLEKAVDVRGNLKQVLIEVYQIEIREI